MSEETAKRFRWDRARSEAAALLAEAELTAAEVAEKLGVSIRQLRRWREHEEFRGRVEQLAKQYGDATHRRAIALCNRRVAELDRRWGRMLQVIEERAADPSMERVPGGKTGLLVRQVKGIGKGENYREVEEYAVDTGLLAEQRATERAAAQELGQHILKFAPTTPDGTEPYDAGSFTPDEVVAILDKLCTRLGLQTAGPAGEQPAVAPGRPAP
jgi:hypothetical protein